MDDLNKRLRDFLKVLPIGVLLNGLIGCGDVAPEETPEETQVEHLVAGIYVVSAVPLVSDGCNLGIPDADALVGAKVDLSWDGDFLSIDNMSDDIDDAGHWLFFHADVGTEAKGRETYETGGTSHTGCPDFWIEHLTSRKVTVINPREFHYNATIQWSPAHCDTTAVCQSTWEARLIKE